MWTTSKSAKNIATTVVMSGVAFFSNAETNSSQIFDISTDVTKNQLIITDLNNIWSSSYVSNISTEYSDTKIDTKADVNDTINLVKVTLGLPNKDIADIFKVTRQTLHNHMNGSVQTMHGENLLRLKKIDRVFNDISLILERSPGALTKSYIINGSSFYDLLIAEELDIDAIKNFAHELKVKMQAKSKIVRENDNISLFQLTRHA